MILDSSDNKYVVLENLIKYLQREISNFDYGKDNNHIMDIFYYIFNILRESKSKNTLSRVHDSFKIIHNDVQKLLLQKPGNIKKDNPNYLLLKNLINNIEVLDLSILSDYIEHYKGSSYEFISYLMFEVENFSFISSAINKYPYIVNFVDSNDCPLFNKIVDKYIDSILEYVKDNKLNDNSKILYYDKLLKCVLSRKEINYTFLMKQESLNKIKHVILDMENFNYSSVVKDKISYWLNELEDTLGLEKRDISYDEFKYRFDIRDNFDYGVMSSVNMFLKKFKYDLNPSNNRRMITIDDEDASEIDDGISIEILPNGNYSLGVHIADPLTSISKNSIIMDEAYNRGTSIYLSTLTIPMFDKNISKNLLSLNEKFAVLVTSYYYEIDNMGNIIDFYIKKENLKSYKKTTYKDVNFILNNMDNSICYSLFSKDMVDDLFLLSSVVSKIKKHFRFNDEYVEIYRSRSNASKTNNILSSKASDLVEVCMVLTNNITAEYMCKHNYPFLYRCHCLDNDFIKKIDFYKQSMDTDDFKKYIDMIRDVYPCAYYDTVNLKHFGLGLDYYSHVTSPLRRYADILCDEALDLFYFSNPDDKEVYKFEEYLKDCSVHINSKCRKANSFTKEYEKCYAKINFK